jgi:hypothetical protein
MTGFKPAVNKVYDTFTLQTQFEAETNKIEIPIQIVDNGRHMNLNCNQSTQWYLPPDLQQLYK